HSGRVRGDVIPNDPHSALEVDHGPGHYVGQTLTIWPTHPLRSRITRPYIGFPYLEGNVKVYVDDEVQAEDASAVPAEIGAPLGRQSIEHTGIEDYALGAWYYRDVPFAGLWHGCPVRSLLTGVVSQFRFHEMDPYPWEQRIRIVMHHGEFDDVNCRMESLAF